MKRIKIRILALLLIACTFLATPLTVNAAFTQRAKIVGNGVRLRRTPGNGTILELMYYGEYIWIDSEMYDPDYSAWIYVKREKTETKGWMEWSYFEHQ